MQYIKLKDQNEYFTNKTYFKEYKNLKSLNCLPTAIDQESDNVPTVCSENFCRLYKDQYGTKCPYKCDCYYQSPKMGLDIMCTDPDAVTEFEALPKPNTGAAALYMYSKNLTKLPKTNVTGYDSLRELLVANNQLNDLTITNLPKNLAYLDISNNSFQFLGPEVLKWIAQTNRRINLKIRISNNPWNCDCSSLDFLEFLERYSKMVEDYNLIKCDGKDPGLKLEECRSTSIYLILPLTILLIATCISVFWFRKPIMIRLEELFVDHSEEAQQRFDAFLAFSHENLDLVKEFVDRLENGQKKFKLCFYQRDWRIGESIPGCILQSIEDSRRIIVLMTPQFLKSSWGTFEFRTAIRATSVNRDKRLIIIVYPEVEDFKNLDSELRIYMKYNTYLRRDDPLFWRKLINVMPHKKLNKSKLETERIEDCEMEA